VVLGKRKKSRRKKNVFSASGKEYDPVNGQSGGRRNEWETCKGGKGIVARPKRFGH